MAYHQPSAHQPSQQAYGAPDNGWNTSSEHLQKRHGYGYGEQGLGNEQGRDPRSHLGYHGPGGGYPHQNMQDPYGPVHNGGNRGQYDRPSYDRNRHDGPPQNQWQEQPIRNGTNLDAVHNHHNRVAPYSGQHPPNGHHKSGYPVASGNEDSRGHNLQSHQQPRKDQPKEQRKPVQSKPNKAPPQQRALNPRPPSPKLMSWDNPFPVFPAVKKKKSPDEEQKMNEMMSGLKVEDKKRSERSPDKAVETAGSTSIQGPSKKSGAWGGDTREQFDMRKTRSSPPDGNIPNYSGPHAYTKQDQDHASAQPYRAHEPAQSRHDRHAPPELDAIEMSRTKPSGHGGNAPLSPAYGHFSQEVHKNQHLPYIQPQQNATTGNPPIKPGYGQWMPSATGAAFSSSDGQGQRRPAASQVLQAHPTTHHTRSNEAHYVRSPTGPAELDSEPVRGPNAQQLGHPASAQPNSGNPHVAHELPADDPQLLQNDRRQSEFDMPNFDAAPPNTAGHRRGMSFEWHLSSQNNQSAGPPLLQIQTQIPVGQEEYPPSDFAAQANRSRSQPDLRAQSASGPFHGYAAEMAGDVPRVPPVPQHARSLQSPPYGQREYNAGAAHYSDLEVIQKGQNRAPPPGQHITPPFGSPTQRRAVPQRGQNYPGNVPRSPTAVRSVSDTASPTVKSPINKPFNPDALPEHPTPIRAGLMAGPVVNQPSKPPPMRQYHNSTPPTPNQSSLPTSSAGRSPEISSPVTHAELERLRKAVKANPSDRKTQLLLASKLEEAMMVLADNSGRADPKTRNKNRERYSMDAFKIVKKLVAAGYPDAMFYMADCYGTGRLGLEIDPKEAFNLYQSAAKAGHGPSAYRAAVCCEMGPEGGGGTKKDLLKAFMWYKKAAMLGDTPAMYKMGMVMLKGLMAQPRSANEGVMWLKRAAEKADEENPHAVHELALLYENGSDRDQIPRDEQYSLELFVRAAELGYKFSQFRLGSAYEYGLMGLPIDPRRSIAWYSKAAVQAEHQSELALSGWYLTGSDGVLQQSDTEAYLWARKAAQAGLAKAEYAMGYFTEVGIGAPANLEDAKRWYWRAADHNFTQARQRLDDLMRGGAAVQQRERISRSKVGRQHEGECSVM